jgi:hypothetical protein
MGRRHAKSANSVCLSVFEISRIYATNKANGPATRPSRLCAPRTWFSDPKPIESRSRSWWFDLPLARIPRGRRTPGSPFINFLHWHLENGMVGPV